MAIVLSFWPPLGGFVLLAFLTALGPWLRAHGMMGMIVYVAVAGVLMGISFVPTYSCAIIAGWAFGFVAGLPLALVAITVASLIAYVIGRWIARDRPTGRAAQPREQRFPSDHQAPTQRPAKAQHRTTNDQRRTTNDQ